MSTISWTQTPTMKKVTLPSGNTYWLKDDEVRQWIGDGSTSGAEKRLSDAEVAIQKLANATHWLGVTTTSISDGSTTNPIIINGSTVTAVSGDIVQNSEANEFIYNGTAWQQLGSTVGTLGNFAYVDTGAVTIKPTGSNSSSSVSGTCAVTPSGNISVGNGNSNYTPEGSCSGTAVTLTSESVGSVTDAGSMPTFTVANEVLVITAGAVPTVSSVSVATGVDTITDPSFTGTGVDLEFTGSSSSGTVVGIAQPQTFSGVQTTYVVNPSI